MTARRIALIAFVFLTVGVFSYLYFTYIYTQSNASSANTLDGTNVAPESFVNKDNNTTDVSIYKEKGYLYKSKSEGEVAALEFIQKKVKYRPDQIPSQENVKGASTDSSPQSLIPDNFAENSYRTRAVDDQNDKFLTDKNIISNAQHFFYQQKINNIPVYGAILSVHLKNKNEVYAVDANLVVKQDLANEAITKDKAEDMALEKAAKDTKITPLKVESVKKYILNKKILGLSDDIANKVTYVVVIYADTDPITFKTQYFVDLSSGQVIFTEPLLKKALTRNIYNCANKSTDADCTIARSEGNVPVGDSVVDDAYSIAGEVYNYHFNSEGRNSWDNNGSPMVVRVHVDGMSSAGCPNAYWIPPSTGLNQYGTNGGYMIACDGLVLKDIFGHEFGHAINGATAGFIYHAESGTLDEAFADIWGYAIDNNWTVGEGSSVGIMRRMDDPPNVGDVAPVDCTTGEGNSNGTCYLVNCTTYQPDSRGLCVSHIPPDRLFSPYFYCGDQDLGGVHNNTGVTSKAFYLMVQGGNFNGCSVNGIGREKGLAIAYYALSRYLGPSSNFKDFYNKFIQSCQELYPNETSTTCENVRKALQATELDQQPEQTQSGPMCSNIAEVTPACAAAPIPTNTPTPSIAIPTPTPSIPYISKVLIQPAMIDTADNQPIGLSALGYDQYDHPIWNGVSYEWGISSNNGIGILSPLYDMITNFTPINSGSGDVYVRSTYIGKTVIKSIPVTVNLSTTVTPNSCRKTQGDANCDGNIDDGDFIQWADQFTNRTTSKSADFNDDGRVDLLDFESWREYRF